MVGGYTPPPPQPAVLPRLVVDGEPPQLLKLKTGRRNKRNLLRYFSVRGLLVLAHHLDSSHRNHFPGLFRRARLRELISRAYLAELIDPNSSDKDIINLIFQLIRQDVLNFKTSSTHPTRVSSTHLPKTHSRHLQLISQRRTQLLFSSSSQDVFAG